MKIAIATAVYSPMINGVAVFTEHLVKGLTKRGHEVLVLCPSQRSHAYTHSQDGVKVVYLPSSQLKFYPDQIHPTPPPKSLWGRHVPRFYYQHGFRVSLFPGPALRSALDHFHPDLVHIQVADPIGRAALAYARKRHLPVVTTEHNQPEVLTDSLPLPRLVKNQLNSFLSDYFVRWQNRGNFATMPTQQAIQDLIQTHGHEFKVPVAAVSNGVDLDHFRPGQPSPAFYQKYGLPQGVPLVLYVGRLDPEKKVDALLTAFVKAAPKIPTAHLVIVGDGVALPALKAQAKKLGLSGTTPVQPKAASATPSAAPDTAPLVHFLGRVTPPDLYQIYQTASVFATMSEIETQGIVLIEAAASGLPLIAVKKGAVGEVCQHRQNGYLCPPGDTTTVAIALVKILQDPSLQAKFRQKSLAVAKSHDFVHTLDQFENIYRKLLQTP